MFSSFDDLALCVFGLGNSCDIAAVVRAAQAGYVYVSGTEI